MKFNYFFILLAAVSLTHLSKDNYSNKYSLSNFRTPSSEQKEENKSAPDAKPECLDKNEKSKLDQTIKKDLKDNIEVVKKLAKEEKNSEKMPKKKKEIAERESESGNINVADLLMNITNMLMSQQQIQMQFQMQMFSMMSSQNSWGMNTYQPMMNPYSFSYFQSPYQYPTQSMWPGYQSHNLLDSMSMYSQGIGIQAHNYGHYNQGVYQPDSTMQNIGGMGQVVTKNEMSNIQNSPAALRQPMSDNLVPISDQKFEVRMFDFNQNSIAPMSQPTLQQMQRIGL